MESPIGEPTTLPAAQSQNILSADQAKPRRLLVVAATQPDTATNDKAAECPAAMFDNAAPEQPLADSRSRQGTYNSEQLPSYHSGSSVAGYAPVHDISDTEVDPDAPADNQHSVCLAQAENVQQNAPSKASAAAHVALVQTAALETCLAKRLLGEDMPDVQVQGD